MVDCCFELSGHSKGDQALLRTLSKYSIVADATAQPVGSLLEPDLVGDMRSLSGDFPF